MAGFEDLGAAATFADAKDKVINNAIDVVFKAGRGASTSLLRKCGIASYFTGFA